MLLFEYCLVVKIQNKKKNGVDELQQILGAPDLESYWELLQNNMRDSISIEYDAGERRIFSIDGQQDVLYGASKCALTARIEFCSILKRADSQRFCCTNNLIETIVGHYNDGGDEALEAMAKDFPNGWKFPLDSNFACSNTNLGGGYDGK
jgi:hypothetical protein